MVKTALLVLIVWSGSDIIIEREEDFATMSDCQEVLKISKIKVSINSGAVLFCIPQTEHMDK